MSGIFVEQPPQNHKPRRGGIYRAMSPLTGLGQVTFARCRQALSQLQILIRHRAFAGTGDVRGVFGEDEGQAGFSTTLPFCQTTTGRFKARLFDAYPVG